MNEFVFGFIMGTLSLFVFWNLINPHTWTPENVPCTTRAHLNFRKADNVVQATIYCPTGRMSPRSGPGYIIQFVGVDPESNPIEPVHERHWGWVQIIIPKEYANSN